MITPEYAQLMARYNRWMNEKIYAAAGRLGEEERKADRGAFFKSIHSTLNHLVWGDSVWLGRMTQGTPLARDYPKAAIGADLYAGWEQLKNARSALDDDIAAWAGALDAAWLARDFSWYSGITKSTRTKPGWLVVTHFFNHQTNHRAQAMTLLSQQGIDAGDTDLILMP